MAIDHGRLRCFFLDNQYGELLNEKTNGCHTSGADCECQYIVANASDSNTMEMLISNLGKGIVVRHFRENLTDKINKDTLDFEIEFIGTLVDGTDRKCVGGVLKGNVSKILTEISDLSREREDRNGCLTPAFLIESIEVL